MSCLALPRSESILRQKLVPLFAACLVSSVSVSAQEETGASLPSRSPSPIATEFEDINQFVTLVRTGFQRAVQEAEAKKESEVRQLKGNYLRQLEQVQRFYNDSGDATAALLTRDEINRVRSGDEKPTPEEEGQYEKLKQSRDRYSEALTKIEEAHQEEVSRLVEIGKEALEKRASELTRQGDLDRVEALTNLLPVWTGRPGLAEKGETETATTEAFGEGDFLKGKRISYAHETKPDSIVSMVFEGDGEATYIGLGGVERPWSYEKGDRPDEYLFWMTGRPKKEGWIYTLKLHPDGRSGMVSKGADYVVEAKVRR